MIILFRSYGGLGNQLYQYFFCILLQKKFNTCSVKHIHSTNYSRYAPWEMPLQLEIIDKNIHKMLIKCRFPMLLSKLGLNKKGYLKIFNLLIVDNYYQDVSFYQQFNLFDIKDVLLKFQNQLFNFNYNNFEQDKIYHFRLGDFFSNSIEEKDFILSTINKIHNNSTIISNNDIYFEDNLIMKKLILKQCKYIKTAKFSSLELFYLFLKFKNIYSNGSSLSFFAATLNNSNVIPISNNMIFFQKKSFNRLMTLHLFLTK
jgi:hypothetical protein